MRMASVVIGALATTTVGVRQIAAQQQIPQPPPAISTSGTGEVEVTPDRATLLFTVETRAQTAAAASQENARNQRQVIDALRRLGLTGDDISTMGYSVTPEQRYDGKEPRITGYVARNTIRA